MLVVRCGCGNEIELGDDLLGRAVVCPSCQGALRAVAGAGLGAGGAAGAGAGEAGLFTCRLSITNGPDRLHEQFVLGGDDAIGIGKLEGKAIRLLTQRVSRNHCELRRSADGGWSIVDLRSTNGLFVNGVRVSGADLHDGDELRIGEYHFRFSNPFESPAAELGAGVMDNDDEPVVELEAVESNEAPPAEPDAAAPLDDDLYDFAEPAPQHITRAPASLAPPAVRAPAAAKGPAPVCPSCRQTLQPGAKICVACGIDVKTGRTLVTSRDIDENDLAIRADTWIRIISWFIWFGLFPIASEAFGTRKPRVTWALTIATVVASCLFFAVVISAGDDELSPGAQRLLLWAGGEEATRDELRTIVEDDLADEADATAAMESARTRTRVAARAPSEQQIDEQTDQLFDLAYPARFHWYQLITHAFLHGGIMHLAGNLLFLLVFGMRVNELIGNLRFAIVYPILAVIAALAHMFAYADQPLHPVLGASGAIMGLAGMYFIFFPVQRVHMAIWWRVMWLLAGFRLMYKIFAMRGFWLLVLWIAFNDLLPMLLGDGESDDVAHWAHLGGFIGGAVIAVGLLLTRQVRTHGGDLISVTLGKHAWPLLGRPGSAAAA